jgi:hypothetical protein
MSTIMREEQRMESDVHNRFVQILFLGPVRLHKALHDSNGRITRWAERSMHAEMLIPTYIALAYR